MRKPRGAWYGCLLLIWSGWALPLAAQNVRLTSSNLPIVQIEMEGRAIPDEPKVRARMTILDGGPGARNRLTDTSTVYEGFVGIEQRGATSRTRYPKKSYAVETRDAEGDNRDVTLLGLPPENDWVLYASYGDKSLLRNVLTFHLARQMGRYASRTRYCEVVLNGRYHGVYVLMEKIKRDDHRVALRTPGPAGGGLTGGYIVKIDKRSGSEVGGWRSSVRSPHFGGARPLYQYHDPKPSEITGAQARYIRGFIDGFEEMMMSDAYEDPAKGYPARIDVGSFVDYFILNELGKNVDGYRLSAYLYKDSDAVDGRLHAGPLWDFNLAFGNADYYGGDDPAGFQVNLAQDEDPFPVPPWWNRLFESEAFRDSLAARWAALRRGTLHEDTLMQFIDAQAALLEEAQARNFERWPVLGKRVWPNAFVGKTYTEEVTYLKDWLRRRLAWLDANLPGSVGTR